MTFDHRTGMNIFCTQTLNRWNDGRVQRLLSIPGLESAALYDGGSPLFQFRLGIDIRGQLHFFTTVGIQVTSLDPLGPVDG
jgi:hypothetical protein